MFDLPIPAQTVLARTIPAAPAVAPLHSKRMAPRAGISLLEVLISIFVLAVGLLSIASLLPVGSFQMQKALIEERKGIVALNGFREFRTRDFSDPRFWTRVDFGSKLLVPVVDPTSGQIGRDPSTGQPLLQLPVAIDPLMIALASQPTPPSGLTLAAVRTFPHNGGNNQIPGLEMQRLGLVTPTSQGGILAMSYPLAETIFMSRDDAVYEKDPNDPDLPPVGKIEFGANNVPLRRQVEGSFTWLVTLAPVHLFSRNPLLQTQVNVSLVVFHKRNFTGGLFNPERDNAPRERMLGVDSKTPGGPSDLSGFGLGGGQLTIHGTEAQTALRPGDWVTVGGTSVLNQADVPKDLRWYRVSQVEPFQASAGFTGQPGRTITLAGPDWNTAAFPYVAVSVYEGVVGVYEKTMHLEGASLWAN